jgi:D-alanine-D-alanine ligase
MRVHKYIGAYGMSRTDVILGHDGNFYVLEINTIPGMTPTSLLPQAALKYGITFPELLDKIINSAFRRHGVTSRGD